MCYQKNKGEYMEEMYFIPLKKFYQKLYDTVEKNRKKLDKGSIFISFLNVKSNVRGDLLRQSAIESFQFLPNIISYLENNNLIRETEIAGHFMISAKGVWEIEKNNEILNEAILLDYLDDKLFNICKSAEKPLSDRLKVVLLSLIAVRVFSIDSPLDLKTRERTLDAIKDTVDESYTILKSLNLISKLDTLDLYGKPGNEHPVSNLLRHTDELPKVTRGIFKAPGNQKYFLDVYKNGQVSKDNLKYLFEKIIGDKKLEVSELDSLSDFCCKIAHDKSIYLFDDIKNYPFLKSKYDDVLKDTLFLLT